MIALTPSKRPIGIKTPIGTRHSLIRHPDYVLNLHGRIISNSSIVWSSLKKSIATVVRLQHLDTEFLEGPSPAHVDGASTAKEAIPRVIADLRILAITRARLIGRFLSHYLTTSSATSGMPFLPKHSIGRTAKT